jgi:hypothetical protein
MNCFFAHKTVVNLAVTAAGMYFLVIRAAKVTTDFRGFFKKNCSIAISTAAHINPFL